MENKSVFYYEVWFYYYDSFDAATQTSIVDARTDYNKEFTFYCKSAEPIATTEDMIAFLKQSFPVCEEYSADQINCIAPEHYDHLSKWFEITGAEFEEGCGISA